MVLTDGGVVHLRPIRPEDAEAVVAFHHRQSPESLYYRYFSPKPTLTAEEVEHLTSVDHVRNMAFVAFDGDQLIGIGRYDHLRGGNEAEVAFQADEGHRGRGLATVFLEYLVAAARDAGLDRLVAQVLPDNRRMLKVFERAGFDAHRQFADGVIEVELGLAPTEQARMAIEDREQRAEARSVATLLAPSAVAVIAGVGEVGDPARAAFAQLLAHDFNGPVIRVGPAAAWDGPSRPGIEEVPEAVDLAVVAVAAEDLPATLAACGAKGVRGALLLTPATDAPADLVALARRSGMRLIGPGALGAVNTAADIRLHASPLAASVGLGPIGFLSQSGSLAAALLQRGGPLRPRVLQRRGGGRQGRSLRQRPPAVLGARRGHPGDRALPPVLRQPAEVQPDRPPGVTGQAHRRGEERSGAGRRLRRGVARRHARRPDAPDRGDPGRHHRGAARRFPGPGQPAGAGRSPGGRGGQRRGSGAGRGRRLRGRRASRSPRPSSSTAGPRARPGPPPSSRSWPTVPMRSWSCGPTERGSPRARC